MQRTLLTPYGHDARFSGVSSSRRKEYMASLAGEKASPARREKFGKFVLLEQVDAANIGAEYRAAKLGSAGLEKIVELLRLSPVLSANADAAKVLMDQAKFAA